MGVGGPFLEVWKFLDEKSPPLQGRRGSFLEGTITNMISVIFFFSDCAWHMLSSWTNFYLKINFKWISFSSQKFQATRLLNK